jgi:hypothetical protein
VRLAVWLTLLFFAGILVAVYVFSERAHPVFIDVDPAAVHSQHGHR